MGAGLREAFEGGGVNYEQLHSPSARTVQTVAPIPMSAKCICGLRYGMHRVKDYACPNPAWKPGNGQLQWLPVKFHREIA